MTTKIHFPAHKKKMYQNIVAYLLKARTVEAEKQPLLGNVRTQK
jgi:hypothetical protein